MTKKLRQAVGYSFLTLVVLVGSVIYAMSSGATFGEAVLGTVLIMGGVALIGTGLFIVLDWIEGDI